MAPDSGPGDQPWYRTPTATFTAGGVGVALVGALVVTVVQMSDEWSQPTTTVLTTTVTPPAPATTHDRQPFIITPSETSTTFTTSVPLSTTDIGMPTEVSPSATSPTTPTTTPTDTTSGTTSATTPNTADMPTTFPSQRRPHESLPDTPGNSPPTTRNRPRYNETRSYIPGQPFA